MISLDDVEFLNFPIKIKNHFIYVCISIDENIKSIDCLHVDEIKKFNKLRINKRKREYINGRFTAKKAISNIHKSIPFRKINIKNGFMGHPYSSEINEEISISHSGNCAVAIVFPRYFVASVDVEKLKENNNVKFLDRYINEKELDKFNLENKLSNYSKIIIWSAKESLSKSLKCGLGSLLGALEISNISIINDRFVICSFKNFKSLMSIGFLYKDFIITICIAK